MKNWTVHAMEALQAAQQRAFTLGHAEITPLHLLAALLDQPGLAVRALRTLEHDPEVLRRTVDSELASMPTVSQRHAPEPGRELQTLILDANRRAQEQGGGMVGTRELLLALAADQGRAGSVLRTLDIDSGDLEQALASMAAGPDQDTEQAETQEDQALARYARDLCDLARRGKIDPIIDRDEEIRRVVQILSRGRKIPTHPRPSSAARPRSGGPSAGRHPAPADCRGVIGLAHLGAPAA